jgi:CheY-like chemotaxis protein
MNDNAILLVEDCSEDASLVQMAFKRWGISNPIKVVPDGESAVDYLAGNGRFADREQYPLPCLALLDLNLPQMSGFRPMFSARTPASSTPTISTNFTTSSST